MNGLASVVPTVFQSNPMMVLHVVHQDYFVNLLFLPQDFQFVDKFTFPHPTCTFVRLTRAPTSSGGGGALLPPPGGGGPLLPPPRQTIRHIYSNL
jgi:hypothetical protein